jgi:hypothetical protein
MKSGNGWAFSVFHYTLAIVVFIESLITHFHSIHNPVEGRHGQILPWFALLEALAAVLFAIPKTVKMGGAILLVIFAVATVLHGPVQQMPLFVYAAGVLLVMFHRRTEQNIPNDLEV